MLFTGDRMKRRLVLQIALSLSLVAAVGTPVVAAIAPLPVLMAAPTHMLGGGSNPSLLELSYERLLEESLQQSLSAYLGPDNFVLQVRVEMVDDTAVHRASPAKVAPVKPPVPQAPQPATDEPLAPEADFDSITALPGLGSPDEERPLRTARQAPAGQYAQARVPAPPMPVQVAPSPATPRIERIRISLVLPKSLKNVDEDYLSNMVFQRADLNSARGDSLDLSRRDFPRTAGAGLTAGSQGKKEGAPALLWIMFGALGASALFGAWYMRRHGLELPSILGFAPPPVPPAPSENPQSAEAIVESVPIHQVAEQAPMRQDLLEMLLERPELGERYLRRLLAEEGGPEKAATFSQAMGMNVARRLFNGLHANEWKAIELTALDQRDLKRGELQAALEEALYAMLRDQAEQQGQEKAAPFSFLKTLEDTQIHSMLEDEGPRVQALVLSQLPPDRAVGLMRLKTPAEQGAVASAMGELHLLPMSSFIDLANRLAEKANEAPSIETPVADGLGLLVDLLDHADRETEQGILNGLSTQNPQLLAQVREVYLTFEDLADVPQAVLKDALREVDKETLAEALREAPEPVRNAVIASLTERARRIVEDVFAHTPGGQQEKAKLDALRKELVGRVRQLMQAGHLPPTRPKMAASTPA